MEIVPLNAPFGATVDGLDPRDRHTDEIVVSIRRALLEYGFLVVRGDVLTKDEQVRFSSRFGELEVFPTDHLVSADRPEVYPVSNVASRGYTEVGQYWHADGSFRQKPTVLSFFHMIEAAAEGGDTAYADMRLARNLLPPEVGAIIDELNTVHGSGMVHRLLRHNDETGDDALFVNLGMVVGLTRPKKPPVGISPSASQEILWTIEGILDRDDVHYRHKWRSGDLIIADNRRIAHKAFAAPAHTERLLHRTTTSGTDTVRG